MTTLQEALDKCEKVAIESGAWESYKAVGEAFTELRTALAQQDNTVTALRSQVEYLEKIVEDQAKVLEQQVEQPTQRQLDTTMRQWETWKAYALELQAKLVKYEGGSPMLLNAAAPAPQAQPLGINGLTEAETDASMSVCGLSAPQSAQDVPEVGFGNIVELARKAYPHGEPTWLPTSEEGKNLHDAETALIRAILQSAQPVAQPNIQKYPEKDNRLSDDEIFAIAHRTATRYTHFVQPGQVMYGFAQHHMIDLVRAIEKAHGIGGSNVGA